MALSANGDTFVRELRIAPVMTGGTSLAVWMGGVTAELYRVLMATRERDNDELRIYRSLLDLTETQPRVDVITGTSAGGLNGAILAAGWHLNLPVDRFLSMREIWLDIGDINELLRSPNESDPPSLLKGDDYFVPKLRDALDAWTGDGDDSGKDRPLDLLVNVTTVKGEPRTRYDDFDQPIGEQGYDHSLNFVRSSRPSDGGPPDRDDFRDRRWIDQFATAARTSASIPFVFEPSYLRVDPSAKDNPVAGRPNYAGLSTFSVSRWAVDGGVLNNLPLGAAIDRIFVQRADREVRRVVLYVMPTPSLPPEAVADDRGDMPKLASVIAGVAAATWVQGVANDIDRLREHNLRASRQRAARVARFTRIDPETMFEETREVWAHYVELRTLTSVNRMLDTAGRELIEPLRAGQVDVEAALRVARTNVMPAPPPTGGHLEFGNAEGDRPWGWGISSLEQAISVCLGIIGSTLALPRPRSTASADEVDATERDRRALGTARDALYDVLSQLHAARRLDEAYWAHEVRVLGTLVKELEGGQESGSGPSPAEVTAGWARRAYEQWPFVLDSANALVSPQPPDVGAALARIDQLRRRDDAQAVPIGLGGGTGNDNTIALLAWVADLGLLVAGQLVTIAVHARAIARAAAHELTPGMVNRLVALPDLVEGLDRSRAASPDVAESGAITPAQTEIVDRLRDIVLQLRQLVVPGATPDDVLRRLLAMHVLDTAYETEITTNEQVLELLQVSWNAPNEIDNRRPAAKLTGNEAARLGAFLKRSWRANDWMWGRLDGAHRLLTLLLDPARLRQLRQGPADVMQCLEGLLVQLDHGDPDETFTRVWKNNEEAIAKELAFLERDATLATPKSLPRTVKVLAYALQTQICRQELPVLHDAIKLSRDAGGNEGDGGAFRLLFGRKTKAAGGQVLPRDVPELLRAARVGEESATDEIGHDMFTRTAGQTAAVAVKVLTGARGQVPLLSRVARPLRAPTMVLYGLTRAMTTDSHFARFLLAVALAVSGALLGVRIADEGAVSGTAAGIAALVFLSALGVALLRSRAWTGLPALALLAVIGLALAGGPGTRQILYDIPDDAPTWKRWGFVDPWSAVLVLLVLVTVAALVGFGRALVGRRRTTPPPGLETRQWETADRGRYYRLFRRGALIVILAPVAMLMVQWVFERVMLGTPYTNDVKNWLIKAARWLDDRSVLLLAIALAVFGAVIGLGYDKLVARWATPAARSVRQRIGRLAQVGAPEGASGAAHPAPLPHPWSRLTSAQRWALFGASVAGFVIASATIALISLPECGLLSLQIDGSENAAVWDAAGSSVAWALVVDYLLLVSYGVGLSLVLAWFASRWNADGEEADRAGNTARAERARRGAWDASLPAWLPLIAAAFDSIENAAFLGEWAGRAPGWADLGSALAYVKWAFLAATVFAIVYEIVLSFDRFRWRTA